MDRSHSIQDGAIVILDRSQSFLDVAIVDFGSLSLKRIILSSLCTFL